MAGYNHFPEIIAKLHKAEHRIVGETAQDIVDVYRVTAAKDTGYGRSSAYIRTSDTSTYGQGTISPPKGVTPLPEVEAPSDDTTAYAAVAAPYMGFPEFGTRYQAPQPAWYPAVDRAKDKFEERLRHIEDYLR